ncbi:hypothetical protein N878_05320 [Pseudomonas sp. EGD-AK9]|nr:hypothetical protein N878_05320 [Pseudomonas sp. EGD-AK9]
MTQAMQLVSEMPDEPAGQDTQRCRVENELSHGREEPPTAQMLCHRVQGLVMPQRLDLALEGGLDVIRPAFQCSTRLDAFAHLRRSSLGSRGPRLNPIQIQRLRKIAKAHTRQCQVKKILGVFTKGAVRVA